MTSYVLAKVIPCHLTVPDAMQGVLDAGYKTKSKSFRDVVNTMLLTDKRIGRGRFTLK